ncbi:MAG: phosphatidylinositol alpha-1,6-mannosyltransferase [Candidatus Peregrinibacteria bacterium Greene0416_62]|nr:MAG: phosphatidylinositol alpha-1,6-mannosyltransferase [Candidatus Peregrinibacteria bacterium Greene0416_62]TSC97267.1 MAG: phosphatidylinositol alpha-1,6-mannosyltransferase [Candidatus Peregrinibacteria bacterium Greene1014_49]
MRIALFSSTIEPKDGYGNITFELAKELHAQGIDLTLFLPKNQKDAAAAMSLPFETACVLPKYIYRIFERNCPGYFRTVDVSGFDLVHDLFSFPYCILAARSAKKAKKPFVIGAQGTHGVRPLAYVPERWLLKKCYKNAAAIAVPSQYTKKRILEEAKKDYAIDVIHNGVRFDRFQKSLDTSAIRNRYAGKKILLTVGGLWGRKGHDLVLRALPEVLKKHPNVVYTMVGDGNARADLEALATSLGIRDAVDFAGRKSGDDLVAYFQACDIYVHTPKVVDKNKFEGFGIVYLEASACGKPIVATDAGGIRDAVLDNETGLIVPDGDIAAITGSIIRLLDDEALAKRLGERGRAYAQENDWSVIAQKFVQLYKKAIPSP